MQSSERIYRTERQILPKRYSKKLIQQCEISRIIYNTANRYIKDQYESTGMWIRKSKMCRWLYRQENYPNWRARIGGMTSYRLLTIIDANWKSYFEGLKEFNKDHSKFRGEPKMPAAVDKSYSGKQLFLLNFYGKKQLKINKYDGRVIFPQVIGITVKSKIAFNYEILYAQILPKYNKRFCLELVYEIDQIELSNEVIRVAAIDPGLNNIITIGTNTGATPLKVPGGRLKSMNQFFNKKFARLNHKYSKLPDANPDKREKLSYWRNRKLEHEFHVISSQIANYCVNHKIDTLVIGKNDRWKHGVKLGKRNNQNFVFLPIAKLLFMIEYKANDAGISVVFQEESYTSRCSFLDNEDIGYHDKYLGKRISRGLFRAADGTNNVTSLVVVMVQSSTRTLMPHTILAGKHFPSVFLMVLIMYFIQNLCKEKSIPIIPLTQ